MVEPTFDTILKQRLSHPRLQKPLIKWNSDNLERIKIQTSVLNRGMIEKEAYHAATKVFSRRLDALNNTSDMQVGSIISSRYLK